VWLVAELLLPLLVTVRADSREADDLIVDGPGGSSSRASSGSPSFDVLCL